MLWRPLDCFKAKNRRRSVTGVASGDLATATSATYSPDYCLPVLRCLQHAFIHCTSLTFNPHLQLLNTFLECRAEEARRLLSPSPAMHKDIAEDDTAVVPDQLKAGVQVRE